MAASFEYHNDSSWPGSEFYWTSFLYSAMLPCFFHSWHRNILQQVCLMSTVWLQWNLLSVCLHTSLCLFAWSVAQVSICCNPMATLVLIHNMTIYKLKAKFQLSWSRKYTSPFQLMFIKRPPCGWVLAPNWAIVEGHSKRWGVMLFENSSSQCYNGSLLHHCFCRRNEW